jgi:crotonobetainyl-CoA:carnitine CoA-transferase CaiB-like acyl-CoA transferase
MLDARGIRKEVQMETNTDTRCDGLINRFLVWLFRQVTAKDGRPREIMTATFDEALTYNEVCMRTIGFLTRDEQLNQNPSTRWQNLKDEIDEKTAQAEEEDHGMTAEMYGILWENWYSFEETGAARYEEEEK